MVCEIIGEKAIRNAIVQMGEDAIGSSSEAIENTTAKVQKLDPSKVYLAESAGTVVLDLVERVTPYENRVEFHESSLGFCSLICSSLIGIYILKCIEGKHRIKDLQAALFSMKEEFDSLGSSNMAKKEKLAEHINQLEQYIFNECANQQQVIDLIISKATQGSLSSIRQASLIVNITQHGGQAAAALSTGTGVAMAACPLFALFFGSKSLRKVAKSYHILQKEREKVEAILLETEGSPSLKHMAMQLRHGNLKKQEEELAVKASKELFTIASGALGTAATLKVLTVSIGMGAGIVFGAALTATGIGAIVTGSIALLIGGVYAVKKNEEDIRYFSADKKAALEQAVREGYLSFLELQKKHVKAQFHTIEKVINQNRGEASEEFYRAKIDEAWSKIQELKSSLHNPKQLSRLERNHQALVLACIGRKLGGKKISSTDLDWTLITKVNEELKRVEKAAEKVEWVKNERKRLSQEHIYAKLLSKFSTFPDGKPVTLEDLKTFETHFLRASQEDKIDLKHLFFDCASFVPNKNNSEWLESMRAITAPIKR